MDNTVFLSFTADDLMISLICMLMGFFGGMADYILKRDDFVKLPKEEPTPMKFNRFFALIMGRTIIGILAGFTVWLLMIGSMLDNKEAIAKLWLLAGIAGFIAPSFAKKYQEKLTNYFLEQINSK